MYQPNYYRNQQQQRMPPMPPSAPEKPKRSRFRIAWFLVPLVVIGAMWISKNTTVTIFWDDIMSMLGIVNTQRYTKLACLFAILLAVLCIVILGRKDDE